MAVWRKMGCLGTKSSATDRITAKEVLGRSPKGNFLRKKFNAFFTVCSNMNPELVGHQ